MKFVAIALIALGITCLLNAIFQFAGPPKFRPADIAMGFTFMMFGGAYLFLIKKGIKATAKINIGFILIYAGIYFGIVMATTRLLANADTLIRFLLPASFFVAGFFLLKSQHDRCRL